jgi:hypothetical protein
LVALLIDAIEHVIYHAVQPSSVVESSMLLPTLTMLPTLAMLNTLPMLNTLAIIGSRVGSNGSRVRFCSYTNRLIKICTGFCNLIGLVSLGRPVLKITPVSSNSRSTRWLLRLLLWVLRAELALFLRTMLPPRGQLLLLLILLLLLFL